MSDAEKEYEKGDKKGDRLLFWPIANLLLSHKNKKRGQAAFFSRRLRLSRPLEWIVISTGYRPELQVVRCEQVKEGIKKVACPLFRVISWI